MSWLSSFKKQPSDMVSAIVGASSECAQVFQGLINDKFGKGSEESVKRWIQVQYEFLFFFTHLAMRFAFSKLGDEKRNKLQDLLGPILGDSTTEAWFGHWPAEYKKGIRNDFFHNMNVAELEYSKCKKLVPEKDESPKDTLFWEFSKNIARLSGYEYEPAVIGQCMVISVEKFKDLKLDKLIDSVGKEI